MSLGLHQLLSIMRQTPPVLDLLDSSEGLRWLDESIRHLVDQFCLSQTDDTVFSVLLESDPPSPYRSFFRGEIQYTLLH